MANNPEVSVEHGARRCNPGMADYSRDDLGEVASHAEVQSSKPVCVRQCSYSRKRCEESEGQMSKNGTAAGALADPSRLQSLDKGDKEIIQVVIETPKGSRNKYAFDSEQTVFVLKKVLPAGMVFPYDFGFIPRTLAEDGDPVDVLVLMDEPAFPGCILKCRLVGIIQGEQGDKKKKERNDRIVAVEKENHSFADIKHIDDLGKQFVRELEEFFVNYHSLSGEHYRIIDAKGPGQARKRIEDGVRAARRG
jgi:inorganic pyrophosphatase